MTAIMMALLFCQLVDLLVTETVGGVVIDHADGLHERVADG